MANGFKTMGFDVGGTLIGFDLDKLTQAYVGMCAGLGNSVDFGYARAMIAELELELPDRTRQRQLSLEEDSGKSFWEDFYAEGFRRLGLTGDLSIPAIEITRRFQRADFETVYPDVVPALDALKAHGVTLGILSNFTPNCEDVLRQLAIHDYFSFFVVSGLAGLEKPDVRIFDLTVRASNSARSDIVYVGDSLFHDVEGAQRAGLSAILVDRHGRFPDYAGLRVKDLRELVAYAGKE